MPKSKLHPATIAAQAGGYLDRDSGALVPAWQPSTTFARGTDYAPLNADNVYGRDDSDLVRMAEGLLAELEGANEALLFPSGMAAIAAIFRTLPAGARVVVQSGIYWGTTVWVRDFCERRSLYLSEVDTSDTGLATATLSASPTDLVFIETPSNPWLKVTDIAAIREAAPDAYLVVDATAATPILSQPLTLGADIVMHSATKAIGGHSDLLAGVLAVRDTEAPTWPSIKKDRHDAGAILGTFEAWLLVRSIRTLPLRVERMNENAQRIAEHLNSHPRVSRVFYPGLPSDPGHDIARKQMCGGFGSLLSVLVEGTREQALQVAGRLELFHRATSLGGVESLVEHRHSIEPDTGIPENLLRLSIGIEEAADLIDDLDQALSTLDG